jgi:hypothetical protein
MIDTIPYNLTLTINFTLPPSMAVNLLAVFLTTIFLVRIDSIARKLLVWQIERALNTGWRYKVKTFDVAAG